MDCATDLICLSYCSSANFALRSQRAAVPAQVSRILVQSRRNNRQRQIGGVLKFGEGCFFQYLEGPADAVDRLNAAICRDPRHDDVQRLTRRPIRHRRFEDWSMKFVALERDVERVLRRHGLQRFDPYRFTPALIDDLVVSMTCVGDDTEQIEAARVPPAARGGMLQRLFSSLF
ncbi:MAG: BLUF domain-containing protein [Wenzhouxiangellaceae bacterium]|nr:BLUF domain-containing protein [Wenzhouxiangellaceae bacterium]